MKIIDTFLFSEPHEKELLLIKLHLEKEVIQKWLILESPYTFQGQPKELHAEKLINGDSRFDEFKDRIVIIRQSDDFKGMYGEVNDERANFSREGQQRQLCLPYLLQSGECDDTDWIMVSDTDEAVDFSDSSKRDIISSILRAMTGQVFKLGRMRYWFDFDNRCYLPNIHIPFVPMSLLKNSPDAISARHWDHIHKVNIMEEKPLAFEYSYCFPSMEDVWRKKCTYSHTGFTLESVQIALECNHWPRSPLRGERVGQEPYDFFEKVELTEINSPTYVRENLQRLKTNIVSENYKENRIARYGA